MRVIVAPDKFAGTLSAPQAAHAIAQGWRRHAPEDELVLVPMSDGGPGFVEVLHTVLGGQLQAMSVSGPGGAPTPVSVLVREETAWIESAQAIGLHLIEQSARDPERATSRGLGEVIAEVAGIPGVRRIVIGLGGTGTNDGGAGLLAALGATHHGGTLDGGPAGLAGVDTIDLTAARAATSGVEIIAASDVESPLLGIMGATKTFGPQKGLPEERLVTVDAWLRHLAELTDRKLADAKGAGAAGGVGFALSLLGATRTSGVAYVADTVGLTETMRGSDLVLTGEGAFDFSSRAGKVPYGVAEVASATLVPCVALAGQVLIGSREMRALGIEAAYSVADLVGQQAAMDHPAERLADLAARVARTWSF